MVINVEQKKPQNNIKFCEGEEFSFLNEKQGRKQLFQNLEEHDVICMPIVARMWNGPDGRELLPC